MLIVDLNRKGRSEQYDLICEFNQELVDKVKILPSDQRSYNKPSSKWTLNAKGLWNLIILYKGRTDINFKFQDDKQKEQFKNIVNKHKVAAEKKRVAEKEMINFDTFILDVKKNLEELTKDINVSTYLKEGVTPYPFQLQGAYFASKLNNGIMAMDLGTGKTITSLLATVMNPECKKVLCIVPASLKLNWQDEVHKFTNEQAYVIKMVKGKLVPYKRNEGIDIKTAKYIILNYDYFNAARFDFNVKIRDIGLTECDTIIFDEAHKLGYKTSNTSKNIKTAFKDIIKRRLLLTGTPVKNKLAQLFPILKMVKPLEFKNEADFYIEYCGMFYGEFGWQPTGKPPKLEELNTRLDTIMYRVRKEDVLKDLPDMIRIKINIEMSDAERKTYNGIKNGLLKYVAEDDDVIETTEDDATEAIVIIGRLRQYTASLKVKQVYDLIKELNNDGEKVVVFDNYKKPLKQLKEKLGIKSELYTGEQNIDQRQALVNKFQDINSDLQNLLISLAAGNAGITLTAAKNLILITQSYVPSENEQAFARIHRIGQKESVNMFICVVDDSIDSIIYSLIGKKQQMISKVIDNIDYEDTAEDSVLADLLREFTIKK